MRHKPNLAAQILSHTLLVAGIGFLLLFTTGCAGSIYAWTVRTTSTPLSTSTESAMLAQGTIAVLTPVSVSSLRGNEAGMGQYLGDVIKKVAPNLKLIEEHQAISLINKQGLVAVGA
jgi:ABC-type molybdate transport system permease subunit